MSYLSFSDNEDFKLELVYPCLYNEGNDDRIMIVENKFKKTISSFNNQGNDDEKDTRIKKVMEYFSILFQSMRKSKKVNPYAKKKPELICIVKDLKEPIKTKKRRGANFNFMRRRKDTVVIMFG